MNSKQITLYKIEIVIISGLYADKFKLNEICLLAKETAKSYLFPSTRIRLDKDSLNIVLHDYYKRYRPFGQYSRHCYCLEESIENCKKMLVNSLEKDLAADLEHLQKVEKAFEEFKTLNKTTFEKAIDKHIAEQKGGIK